MESIAIENESIVQLMKCALVTDVLSANGYCLRYKSNVM